LPLAVEADGVAAAGEEAEGERKEGGVSVAHDGSYGITEPTQAAWALGKSMGGAFLPQQRLNLREEPQGQGALRGTAARADAVAGAVSEAAGAGVSEV
jgi:hypothetical protein